MRKLAIEIQGIPALVWGVCSRKVYIYIHGQGGCKEEAEAFSNIAVFNGWQVLSIDLPQHGERKTEDKTFEPWNVVPELRCVMDYAKNNWKHIALFANSIGAYFSMLSFSGDQLENALFVSPVLDMKRLIANMMRWAGVTESQLKKERIIQTSFGQPLSWDYREYVIAHPIVKWDIPTQILYGADDNMIERQTIEKFSHQHQCKLTVMENGEHWFHTEEECSFYVIGRKS